MEQVKWLSVSNANDTATLKQHAYIHHVCKVRYTDEKYNGNLSLCKRSSVINEDELRISIEGLENETPNESKACKICMKKYGLLNLMNK